MTRPQRYLFRMIVFLIIVAAACAALAPQLQGAFIANIVLNGLIVGVMFMPFMSMFPFVIIIPPPPVATAPFLLSDSV